MISVAASGFDLGSEHMNSTYSAEIYDLVTPASVLGDVEFYANLAVAARGPVLELGAGTGRISLALARQGVQVTALDADRGMLARLNEKRNALDEAIRARVSIVEADMRSFRLAQRFALVIAPFRAFLHNLTTQDQLQCAKRVFDHLVPAGTFALNVFHPSLSFMSRNAGPLEGVWRQTGEWCLESGEMLILSEANRYDTIRKVVHSRHRYERYDAMGRLVDVFLQRLELAYLYASDLSHLFAEAGFADITICGGFDGRPLSTDLDEIVVTARRPD